MIQERALVISQMGELIKIKTQRQSACQACELKNSCGQGLISKLAQGHGVEMELPNTCGAREGDVVIVSVPDEGLLKAAAIMFLIPLVWLILFAYVARIGVGLSDAWVALSGLLGLSFGLLHVRRVSGRLQGDRRYEPFVQGIALHAPNQAACQSQS